MTVNAADIYKCINDNFCFRLLSNATKDFTAAYISNFKFLQSRAAYSDFCVILDIAKNNGDFNKGTVVEKEYYDALEAQEFDCIDNIERYPAVKRKCCPVCKVCSTFTNFPVKYANSTICHEEMVLSYILKYPLFVREILSLGIYSRNFKSYLHVYKKDTMGNNDIILLPLTRMLYGAVVDLVQKSPEGIDLDIVLKTLSDNNIQVAMHKMAVKDHLEHIMNITCRFVEIKKALCKLMIVNKKKEDLRDQLPRLNSILESLAEPHAEEDVAINYQKAVKEVKPAPNSQALVESEKKVTGENLKKDSTTNDNSPTVPKRPSPEGGTSVKSPDNTGTAGNESAPDFFDLFHLTLEDFKSQFKKT